MNKDLIGKKIIAVGKDWMQVDDGQKLYLDEIEVEE